MMRENMKTSRPGLAANMGIRRLGLAAAVLSACMLMGCGSGANASAGQDNADLKKAEIVLKAGEVNPEDNINAKVLHYFADTVKEMTDGRIQVEIYAGGQLGDERTEIQAVQMGALDMFRANTITMGDFGADEMNIFGLPYLFEGREHLWKVLKSDIGRDILDSLQKERTDMVALAFVDEGARNFFAKEPINKPEDLKGMKLRVSETSILLDTVSCFGASPTPISMSELYTSLQTGVVDGADQPLSGYISNSFSEITPNIILDYHTYSPGVIIFSEYRWNKLSPEDQEILRKAAEMTEDYNRDVVESNEEMQIAELRKAGVNVVEVPDFAPWQAVVQPVYEVYAKGYEDIVEQIREMK